jgi:hypothetical protein
MSVSIPKNFQEKLLAGLDAEGTPMPAPKRHRDLRNAQPVVVVFLDVHCGDRHKPWSLASMTR